MHAARDRDRRRDRLHPRRGSFGVIAGNDKMRQVAYPPGGEVCDRLGTDAVPDSQRRGGGKLKGRRRHGDRHLAAHRSERSLMRPGRVCHAILLTDGENEHETREQLESRADGLRGKVPVRLPGVGTDWEVTELRMDRIGAARRGGHSSPSRPRWRPTFRAMIEAAMGKTTGDRVASVDAPQVARVRFCVRWPRAISDLSSRAVAQAADRRLSDR